MDGQTRPLPQPFVVLATDNPIEYEGTYELPEAQLDRFLMRLRLGYLDSADEAAMLQQGGWTAGPRTRCSSRSPTRPRCSPCGPRWRMWRCRPT